MPDESDPPSADPGWTPPPQQPMPKSPQQEPPAPTWTPPQQPAQSDWPAAPTPPPTQGWTPQPPQQQAPPSQWTPPGQPQPTAAWTPPGQPADGPPAKRGGIKKRWIVLAAVVAIAGFAGFTAWQREQTYQTGHAAYLAADCAAAVGPLRSVAGEDSSSGDSDTELKARAELQECEALLAADAIGTQGNAAEAVLAYREFITKYPRSPLVGTALAGGQELISTAPESVASVELCDALDGLEAEEFIASPADSLPALLYACGQVYEAERAFADALAAYGRFRAEYADHDLADDVETAYARAILEDADEGGAGELPSPDQGRPGGVPDLATIVIQNDAPDILAMVFSGPDVRVEEVEACAECQKYLSPGPPACPELGPVAEYVVEPGTYDVVVRSGSGSDVTPFRGTWILEAGLIYDSCFYIVTTSQ